MTGFGRGEVATEKHNFTVEIRSVNHRFCEVVIRMPRSFNVLEDKVRKLVQEKLSRGRIEVFITIEECIGKEKNIKIDKGLALSYYNALKELSEHLSLEDSVQLNMIAKFPEVIKLEESEENLETIWEGLGQALDLALKTLKQSRADEGERLQKDIALRLETLATMIKEIESRSPQVVEAYAQRLRNRLEEVLKTQEIDETRLAMEIALLADRSNITEELVRLNSHLEQFNSILANNQAVGRQLDFMVQEINREINTIGSKANDYQIAHHVIGIKSEIEKIREQIQNIE